MRTVENFLKGVDEPSINKKKFLELLILSKVIGVGRVVE